MLKSKIENLKSSKYQEKVSRLLNKIQKINNKEYNFMLLAPSLCLISPGRSWIKMF